MLVTKALLYLLKLNVFNLTFDFFSGFADCCVLQQRGVNPLLFGGDAVAHSEGKQRFKPAPHSIRASCRSGCVLPMPAVTYHDSELFVSVHAGLMGLAENTGNLPYRDLECDRQYICWNGNPGEA